MNPQHIARGSTDLPAPADVCSNCGLFNSASPHISMNMTRELIDTGTDKRYVRRDKDGRFKESDDVGRSLAQDQKRDSKVRSKKGEGDRGDFVVERVSTKGRVLGRSSATGRFVFLPATAGSKSSVSRAGKALSAARSKKK